MTATETTSRVDIYTRVTNRIVEALESGHRPWLKPWNAEHAAGRITRPLRHNGTPYSGINVICLWMEAETRGFVSPYWLTYKQAQELGGHVKKGEHGAPVVYANTFKKTETADNGDEVERDIPFLKQYTVFAADQVEGLPAHFYELAKKPTEIYSTHSPFMIDSSNLLRVRTVEDVFIPGHDGDEDQDLGTKVGDQVLSTDSDTLFPLRACLGYEITQTLFVGEHALLVEGPSEILYLPWFSRKLVSLGRTGLDRRWSLTPCGGVDKIPAFLSLFSGQKLHIATLVDYAVGQKKKVEQMLRSKLLQDGHVLTADTYAGQEQADIEDIIGREMYVGLVNACYSLASTHMLPTAKPSDAPIRCVQEAELAVDGFDHFRPAEFLTQQGLNVQLPGLEAALDRFEKLFRDVNALLPRSS